MLSGKRLQPVCLPHRHFGPSGFAQQRRTCHAVASLLPREVRTADARSVVDRTAAQQLTARVPATSWDVVMMALSSSPALVQLESPRLWWPTAQHVGACGIPIMLPLQECFYGWTVRKLSTPVGDTFQATSEGVGGFEGFQDSDLATQMVVITRRSVNITSREIYQASHLELGLVWGHFWLCLSWLTWC